MVLVPTTARGSDRGRKPCGELRPQSDSGLATKPIVNAISFVLGAAAASLQAAGGAARQNKLRTQQQREQQDAQRLDIQLMVNEMVRNTAPSLRSRLMVALWGLANKSDHAKKDRMARLRPPEFTECPLWQLVKFLNQAGAALTPEMECKYLEGGQEGPQLLREDAATFMRRWLFFHFLLCLTTINSRQLRFHAALRLQQVNGSEAQVQAMLQRCRSQLRQHLVEDRRYADDLPRAEREFALSLGLEEEVERVNTDAEQTLLPECRRRQLKDKHNQFDVMKGAKRRMIRH